MNLSPEEEKERAQLRAYMMSAKTLAEVKEARRRMREWLEHHPDDFQILGEGESLSMLESALMEPGEQ